MKGARRGSLEVTLDKDLCVLRGASAEINCWYSKPFSRAVTAVGWWKQYQEVGYWRPGSLPNFRDYSQHYRYLGDFISDCRLQIHDVQHADAGNYVFRFYIRSEKQTSKTSTELYVKGNNRNKPASKCLNHPSNFTLFPVIQSWRLLCSRAPWRKATSSGWPVCRAVPRQWTLSGSRMENL